MGSGDADTIKRWGVLQFQSSLPAWGAASHILCIAIVCVISILAPRMGSGLKFERVPVLPLISILAPRMGSGN